MFEELFSRKQQSKTTARTLPKEVDAVQKVQRGGSRKHSSSITVDRYLWIKRVVVGCIVLVGVGIIAAAAYGLVSDFITYSSGVPGGSGVPQHSAVEQGE